jgi:hypothetical protein
MLEAGLNGVLVQLSASTVIKVKRALHSRQRKKEPMVGCEGNITGCMSAASWSKASAKQGAVGWEVERRRQLALVPSPQQ